MSYRNLLNQDYEIGNQDCYGLMRQYYLQNYNLKLTNYARPFQFWKYDLDLISKYFSQEGFNVVETFYSHLEVGDGIIMAISGSNVANHVAAYVGNNYMIHHLYNQKSVEETFDLKWKKRVLTIVRHPQVTEQNNKIVPKQLSLYELMPHHVKVKFSP